MISSQKSTKDSSKIACLVCGKSHLILEQRGLFDDRYGYPETFDLYACASCDFRQLLPRLNESQLAQLYSNYYPRQNFDPEKFYRQFKFNNGLKDKLLRWFTGENYKSFYHAQPNSTVLDIGYGNGTSLFFLNSLGCQVYGIEVDQQVAMKELAKKLRLTLEQGNIFNSAFNDNMFDTVLASQVLEHIPEPVQFLQACAKKLKPRGQLILSFPNYNALSRLCFNQKWIHWHIPYHLNFFTTTSFGAACSKAGLKVVMKRTITPEIWRILQILRLFEKPSIRGKRTMLWSQQEVLHKPVSPLTHSGRMVAKAGLNIINRLIDFLGMGDSYLVVLEKR